MLSGISESFIRKLTMSSFELNEETVPVAADISREIDADDPFQWLEEVEGERAIAWVKEFNEKSTSELTSHPNYKEIHQEIRNIIFAKDRIPFANFEDGYFWNFWEDETYKHGLLRRCSLEEYKKENPQWEIKLDLDKVSSEEGENWVYSSRGRFERHCPLGFLALSRGGKDAVVIREFDFEKGEFITDFDGTNTSTSEGEGGEATTVSAGAFNVSEAKTDVTPFDRNHLFIGSDFGEGSLTTSGYPRTIKLWKRGEKLLEDAKTVFEGQATDVSVSASVVKDYLAREQHILFYRSLDFYNNEIFYQQTLPLTSTEDSSSGSSSMDGIAHRLTDGAPALRKLPIPSTAALLDILDGQVYIRLKEPLEVSNGSHDGGEGNHGSRSFPNNCILRNPLSADSLLHAEVIFSAAEGQSIEDVSVWTNRLFVTILDKVRSCVLDIQRNSINGQWHSERLPFPSTGMITLSVQHEDEPETDLSLITYTDHLTPYSQYLVHGLVSSSSSSAACQIEIEMELLKSAPHRFDANAFEVHQHFVTSKDGMTQIPYFLLHRKDLALSNSGPHPTILYGYGGFEISLTPSYSGVRGKVWLERGGVYAIANIRGGGEFGPAWHQAALKTKRQVAYDDFYSVAEDLIARGITSPRHLGINGGSNGGLLVGVALTQRPELFQAVLIQVPLLDMMRFHLLLAGASWIGEYGDPAAVGDNVEEAAFLRSISPYHNIKSAQEVAYPKPFLTTSTKDDRVHPGHARKMVARLHEFGHSLLYYENINGGHAGSANLEEYALMTALEYTYMWQRLAREDQIPKK